MNKLNYNLYEKWDCLWEKEYDLQREIDYHVSTRQPLYELLKKSIFSLGSREGLRALEIGCGTAIDSCILSQATGIRIFCLDIFHSALKLAKKIASEFDVRITFLASDAKNTCFKDNSFDLIFSQGVLEHFRNIGPFMEEQVRLLKEDGILIIDVPQTFTLCTLFKHHRIRKGTWPFGWETQFSYRDLVALGNRFGLKTIDVCGHEYDTYIRFFNFALFRNIIKRLQKVNPLRETGFFKEVEVAYDKFWLVLEKKWGYYFLINVAMAFKKKNNNFIKNE